MISSLSRSTRFCSNFKVFFCEMSSTRIKVQQGVVRGSEEKLPNGRAYLRFSGIPFAKPPINELRFHSPQKLEKFDEAELDCTRERDACFHKCTITKKYTGSEDCLNLNVYVPVQEDPVKLAVMVYIHGGGFKYDSNSKKLYSPEYLLMENVIVVTINYRLQALGFMSIPNMGISGNAGLKDQQMALEWVYENISNFSGDPDKICLFGESGGGASVHFQVMNSKSRKFISSAICQSGTIINDWAFYGQTNETVIKLAKLLGCRQDSMDEVYKTLMAAPTKALYDNCDKVLTAEDQQMCIRNKWRMVIEEESDDAFITKSSIESITSQRGEINFPMIFGTNNGDGMIVVASIISRNRLKINDENFNFMLPRSLKTNTDEEAKNLADQMRKLYLNGEKLSLKNVKEFVTLRTDVDYLTAQTISNELFARYQPGCKQFLYEFQFDGKLNLQKKKMKMDYLPLAGHGDDIFYLFGGDLANQVAIEENSREWKMRKTMCKLWTNFAKFHDPTPDHDNPLPFKWSPVQTITQDVKNIDLDYLVINDEMKMVRNLNKERKDFWRNAYRKWNQEFLKAKL